MANQENFASAHPFPIPEVIPIFPLPNVVFFPHTILPLHIFEPRYRKMIADASEQGQCIGMALLKEGWEEQYYGHPPIYGLGCVGRMVRIHKMEDGRFNIILEGLHRYEVEEELFDQGYRQAKISLRQPFSLGSLEDSLRLSLTRVAKKYLETRNVAGLGKMLETPKLTDLLLVSNLSSSLDFTIVEKQFLLESDSLSQQTRRLIDLIKFKTHERHSIPRWG